MESFRFRLIFLVTRNEGESRRNRSHGQANGPGLPSRTFFDPDARIFSNYVYSLGEPPLNAEIRRETRSFVPGARSLMPIAPGSHACGRKNNRNRQGGPAVTLDTPHEYGNTGTPRAKIHAGTREHPLRPSRMVNPLRLTRSPSWRSLPNVADHWINRIVIYLYLSFIFRLRGMPLITVSSIPSA